MQKTLLQISLIAFEYGNNFYENTELGILHGSENTPLILFTLTNTLINCSLDPCYINRIYKLYKSRVCHLYGYYHFIERADESFIHVHNVSKSH